MAFRMYTTSCLGNIWETVLQTVVRYLVHVVFFLDSIGSLLDNDLLPRKSHPHSALSFQYMGGVRSSATMATENEKLQGNYRQRTGIHGTVCSHGNDKIEKGTKEGNQT